MCASSPPLVMREMQIRGTAHTISAALGCWHEKEIVAVWYRWGQTRALWEWCSHSGKQTGCFPHMKRMGWPWEPVAPPLGIFPKPKKTHVHTSVPNSVIPNSPKWKHVTRLPADGQQLVADPQQSITGGIGLVTAPRHGWNSKTPQLARGAGTKEHTGCDLFAYMSSTGPSVDGR